MKELIEIATAEGIDAFRQAIHAFPGERFYAFCFYVDSELSSVYPHANTCESLMRTDCRLDPNYYKWAPAEWPLEFGQSGDLMPQTNIRLGASYSAASTAKQFAKYKQEAIASLSAALINIKQSGVFDGHADTSRLAFWVNVGDACGEEEWMFEPVIDYMPADVVEQLRALFEFKAQRLNR